MLRTMKLCFIIIILRFFTLIWAYKSFLRKLFSPPVTLYSPGYECKAAFLSLIVTLPWSPCTLLSVNNCSRASSHANLFSTIYASLFIAILRDL